MDIVTRLKPLFARLLEIDEQSIRPDSSPANVSTWDSLQHINLILALEEEFGVMVDPEDIQRLDTFAGLCAYFEQRMS
ncbi:MAG: acyl carrier protein [candidate division Zixibacteria bacterium]|nr:acyl carrier protein [candidate division Zixibacteria bacterium]